MNLIAAKEWRIKNYFEWIRVKQMRDIRPNGETGKARAYQQGQIWVSGAIEGRQCAFEFFAFFFRPAAICPRFYFASLGRQAVGVVFLQVLRYLYGWNLFFRFSLFLYFSVRVFFTNPPTLVTPSYTLSSIFTSLTSPFPSFFLHLFHLSSYPFKQWTTPRQLLLLNILLTALISI
jgi:hypothetical protein